VQCRVVDLLGFGLQSLPMVAVVCGRLEVETVEPMQGLGPGVTRGGITMDGHD
jgi:hypothetical protein